MKYLKRFVYHLRIYKKANNDHCSYYKWMAVPTCSVYVIQKNIKKTFTSAQCVVKTENWIKK